MEEGFGLPGMMIEIGRPVSTDGGVVFVIRNIRGAAWFKRLLPSLRSAIAAYDGERYGYARVEKLQRGLLALMAGLAMGYRSVKAIADVIETDPLWRRSLGKRISQPDLSRLMELLARVGEKPLKRALAASAAEGRGGLHIDGDSTLIELHGSQEGSSYNGHYHCTGYHSGWMVDTEVGKVAAFWLNPGKAYTSEGQTEVLMDITEMGLKVRSYRGDAGMPSPELMTRLEQDGAAYTLRLKSNPKLDRHEEMVKNEAWAQILALAFNVLVDLRKTLPREGAIRKALRLTQDLADPGFVAIAIERVKAFASANLTMFRAHALKLFNVFVSHARGEKLRVHPTLMRPGWPGTLLEATHALE